MIRLHQLTPRRPTALRRRNRQNLLAATNQRPRSDATTTAAIDKSTLTEVPSGKLKTEELIGTTVYGANDENIGEISDIVLIPGR